MKKQTLYVMYLSRAKPVLRQLRRCRCHRYITRRRRLRNARQRAWVTRGQPTVSMSATWVILSVQPIVPWLHSFEDQPLLHDLCLEVIGLLEHAVIVKDHETERETQVWLTPRYHVPYGWVLALKGSVTVQKGSTINPFSIGIASCDRGSTVRRYTEQLIFFHDVVCYQGPEILLLLIQYTTHRSLSKSSY